MAHQQKFNALNENDAVKDVTLNSFFNLTKEKHDVMMQAGQLAFAIEELEGKDEKSYNLVKDKFKALRDEHYPDITLGEFSAIAVNYSKFLYYGLNLNYVKHFHEMNDLGEMGNTFFSESEKGTAEHRYIKPVPIKTFNPELSKADRMRRRHRSTALQTADTITVFLPNSFVLTRIRRPTRLEQVELMTKIEKGLRQYGEQWMISGLKLERGGIAKFIFDFFIELVVYHSVEDVDIKEDLASIILYNDIDTIAIALLEAGSPKGVHYHLTCLANRCGHSEYRQYEPSELFLVLKESFTVEQTAFISGLPGGVKKYSKETIRQYQNQYQRKGVKIDTAVPMYTEDNTEIPYGEINIGIPTVEEYFNTFAFMSELYNDVLKQHNLDYGSDSEKHYQKRSELLGSTRMGQYLHLIKNYTVYPVDGEETIVEDRSDGEQRQYEEGLLYIFGDDEKLYVSVMKKIRECVPFMTHCITGIIATQCPSCGQHPDPDDDTTLLMAKESGFTPLDPVTNFFVHTQMNIIHLGRKQRSEEESMF